MRGTERGQGDIQLFVGDVNVACGGEQLMEQGSALLIDPGVVSSQERHQIALGLIGDHLDDVGQVLAFCGELDHGPLAEVSDLDALGDVAALVEQPGDASACIS